MREGGGSVRARRSSLTSYDLVNSAATTLLQLIHPVLHAYISSTLRFLHLYARSRFSPAESSATSTCSNKSSCSS